MNANASSRPITQQSANSWIPLLAAVLVAIALVIGVAGVAALTAKSITSTSPMFVPQRIVDHPGKDELAPAAAPVPYFPTYEWINGVPHAVTAPVAVPLTINIDEQHATPFASNLGSTQLFVPQSNNIHEQLRTQSLGVPYPGGLAGPSQVSLPGVPFPGGLAGPSQLDRFVAPGMGGH